jgi:hypothetical protein
LKNDPPIVGRVLKERFTIEMRTLTEGDLREVGAALKGMRDEG